MFSAQTAEDNSGTTALRVRDVLRVFGATTAGEFRDSITWQRRLILHTRLVHARAVIGSRIRSRCTEYN